MLHRLPILLMRQDIPWSSGLFVAIEISILVSTGITVLMAVSRLIAVVFPLQIMRLCSIVKMYFYLLATIMFAKCYDIPRILYLFKIRIIFWNTITNYQPIVYCAIPMIIITSITIILIIKLNYLSKRRAQMTRSQQQKNTATRVLIAVLILFIVCSIPLPVYILISRMNLIFMIWAYEHVIFFFHVINSSANFLIYMTLSKQYRTVVMQLFRCCRAPTQTADANQRNCQREARETRL